MNKSRPYAAISVKDVQAQGLAKVMEGLDGPAVWVGIDVSKAFVMVAVCVGPGRFGRPWRAGVAGGAAVGVAGHPAHAFVRQKAMGGMRVSPMLPFTSAVHPPSPAQAGRPANSSARLPPARVVVCLWAAGRLHR